MTSIGRSSRILAWVIIVLAALFLLAVLAFSLAAILAAWPA